jgi:hypothetical protein
MTMPPPANMWAVKAKQWPIYNAPDTTNDGQEYLQMDQTKVVTAARTIIPTNQDGN